MAVVIAVVAIVVARPVDSSRLSRSRAGSGNIGVSIITYIILGVPCYIYSIICPKTLL